MNYRITILLIIALLSVSTSPIVAKTLTGVPAVSISFWRMFIGSFLLWIYSVFYNIPTFIVFLHVFLVLPLLKNKKKSVAKLKS